MISNPHMDAKCGNWIMKEKTRSHLKTMTIKKGNSNLNTNKNLMINMINKNNPDILVITEVKVEHDNKTLKIDYKGYNIESKILGNNKYSRIIVMIRDGMTYERITKIEMHDKTMILLKIKNIRQEISPHCLLV